MVRTKQIIKGQNREMNCNENCQVLNTCGGPMGGGPAHQEPVHPPGDRVHTRAAHSRPARAVPCKHGTAGASTRWPEPAWSGLDRSGVDQAAHGWVARPLVGRSTTHWTATSIQYLAVFITIHRSVLTFDVLFCLNHDAG